MQELKELFNKQRVILILCLVILTAAIALFAVSSNSAESLSVFRYTDNNSAAKNISYTDNYYNTFFMFRYSFSAFSDLFSANK